MLLFEGQSRPVCCFWNLVIVKNIRFSTMFLDMSNEEIFHECYKK